MNQEETPATVIQLAAALAALGAYGGANTAAEHAAAAKRLDDSEEFYRMRLAYALLGAAEKQAALAETTEGPEDRVSIAHQQALECAGVTESSALLLDFLRWRTLGVGLTLRQIIQEPGIGAVPLAAAWAAEGLQLLLGVVGSSQKLDPETFSAAEITANLNEARGCLESAIANLDLMLHMIAAAGGLGAGGRPEGRQGA